MSFFSPAIEPFRPQISNFPGSSCFRRLSVFGTNPSRQAGTSAIRSLAASNGFEVDTTENTPSFSDENLDRYAAVVFLSTTGDVLDSLQQAAIQTATIRRNDSLHLSTRDLPPTWVRTDEWYNFQSNPAANVTVLLSLDESTYIGGTMGTTHPIAWLKTYDNGRAWYTALGHTTESFSETMFLKHLLGGILWAAKTQP